MPSSVKAKPLPSPKKPKKPGVIRELIRKRFGVGGAVKEEAPKTSYITNKEKKKRYKQALDEAGDIGRKKKKS